MKKFDRLPPEQRKQEIRAAALRLFNRKGFAATTMENIVAEVSLSKGGVYRLYPSTPAILSDLMIEGMQLRNRYYAERVQEAIAGGQPLTMPFLVEMIADSLLLYPDYSAVYAEFLWEKQRRPELEALYRRVSEEAVRETDALIRQYGADSLLLSGRISPERLTALMNAAILSLHTLHMQATFAALKKPVCEAVLHILEAGQPLQSK